MIAVKELTVDRATKAVAVAVTANGHCRIQWATDGPFEHMNLDTAPTPSAPGVYSASKTLTGVRVANVRVWGNDESLQLPALSLMDPPGTKHPAWVEQQQRIRENLAGQAAVTSRLG